MNRAVYEKMTSSEQLEARKQMGHRAYIEMMRGPISQKRIEEGRAALAAARVSGALSASISRMVAEVSK